MKREWIFAAVGVFVILALFLLMGSGGKSLTGGAVDSPPESLGPSGASVECMSSCMKCTSPGVGCTGNQQECQAQCGVEPAPTDDDSVCMENCIKEGCGEYDFDCQNSNREKCEDECDMVKEPEAQSDEEQCIRDCVNLHDPDAECANSQDGETGNDVCQMCAQQCVHLYEGPCLNDEQIRERESECKTCEHCYGEPVMGPSGQGWECIVDIECFDASGEWGDNPGTGDDNWEEGHEPGSGNVITETVGSVVESIGDFFGGLFG